MFIFYPARSSDYVFFIILLLHTTFYKLDLQALNTMTNVRVTAAIEMFENCKLPPQETLQIENIFRNQS